MKLSSRNVGKTRKYEHLKEDENLLDYIARHNIKDTVDLVMFLEGEW